MRFGALETNLFDYFWASHHRKRKICCTTVSHFPDLMRFQFSLRGVSLTIRLALNPASNTFLFWFKFYKFDFIGNCNQLWVLFPPLFPGFLSQNGKSAVGAKGKKRGEGSKRGSKREEASDSFAIFSSFPTANCDFMACSLISTILQATQLTGDRLECGNNQKRLFYQQEWSGCQLGAARVVMRRQIHKVVFMPSENVH